MNNKLLNNFVNHVGAAATPEPGAKTKIILDCSSIYSEAVEMLQICKQGIPEGNIQIESHTFTDGSTVYYIVRYFPDERKNFFYKFCDTLGLSMSSMSWTITLLAFLVLALAMLSKLLF